MASEELIMRGDLEEQIDEVLIVSGQVGVVHVGRDHGEQLQVVREIDLPHRVHLALDGLLEIWATSERLCELFPLFGSLTLQNSPQVFLDIEPNLIVANLSLREHSREDYDVLALKHALLHHGLRLLRFLLIQILLQLLHLSIVRGGEDHLQLPPDIFVFYSG